MCGHFYTFKGIWATFKGWQWLCRYVLIFITILFQIPGTQISWSLFLLMNKKISFDSQNNELKWTLDSLMKTKVGIAKISHLTGLFKGWRCPFKLFNFIKGALRNLQKTVFIICNAMQWHIVWRILNAENFFLSL